MTPRRIGLSLSTLLSLVLSVSFHSTAQSVPNPNSPPVKVTWTLVSANEPGVPGTATPDRVGAGLALHAQNVSERCVRGIVLSVQFSNSEGKTTLTRTRTLLTATKSGGLKCLHPGESFHWPPTSNMFIPTEASGNPDKYAINLDFVVFDDRSTWGPGRQKAADNRLLGMMETLDLQQQQAKQKP